MIPIADDQKDVLNAILEVARAEDAPSTEPADLLAAVEGDASDLVITHYDTLDMTGAERGKAVHDLAPQVPVILVTAFASIAGRAGSGFEAVIAKPVDRAALVMAADTFILQGKSQVQAHACSDCR